MPAPSKPVSKGQPGAVVRVDFTGTSTQNDFVPGEYLVRVKEVEQKISDSSNKPYLSFKFEVVSGDYEGRLLYINHSLQPQALFGLRKTLEACGIQIPQAVMDLNLKKLIGYQMIAVVDLEKYEGKTRAKIVDQKPIEDSPPEEPEGAVVSGPPDDPELDP